MHLSSSTDLATIAQAPSAIAGRKSFTFNRHPYVRGIHSGISAVMKQKHKYMADKIYMSFVEHEAE